MGAGVQCLVKFFVRNLNIIGGDSIWRRPPQNKEGNVAQLTPIHECLALTRLSNVDCVQLDYMSPYMGDKEVEIA